MLYTIYVYGVWTYGIHGNHLCVLRVAENKYTTICSFRLDGTNGYLIQKKMLSSEGNFV